jgi:DNA-binding transcriptional LysR family regulator
VKADIPNLRHLRAFREVAKHRSVSKASEKVFLSQPAITQAIAKLERELNELLFERRSDGMHLTEAGETFLPRVNRALYLLQTGVRESIRLGGSRQKQRHKHVDVLLTATQSRALLAVAEARNFSLAARNIGTSQPSLYRAARDLEQSLQTVLFEKTRQGIALTRAAELLARQVKLARVELIQGSSEVAALRGVETSRIVVGTLPLARGHLLPKAIDALQRQRPEVDISVIDGPYDDLLRGLRHGDIDLLIGALREPLPVADVAQEALFHDRLAIIARRGHPLERRRDIRFDELMRYPWAVPRPGTPTRRYFDALLASHEQDTPRGLVESGSLVLIRELMLVSDRLSIISESQTRNEQHYSELVTLDFDLSHTTRPIGLTTRRDWLPTRAQAQFIDRLRAAGPTPPADKKPPTL